MNKDFYYLGYLCCLRLYSILSQSCKYSLRLHNHVNIYRHYPHKCYITQLHLIVWASKQQVSTCGEYMSFGKQDDGIANENGKQDFKLKWKKDFKQ